MKANKQQIHAAATAFCTANPEYTISESETGVIRFIKEGTPRVEDPLIWEEQGNLACSDPEFGMMFAEYIRELAEPTKGPEKATSQAPKDLVPSEGRKAQGGLISRSDMLRIGEIKEKRITSRSQDPALAEFHRKKSSMYQTEDGQAPTAAMVSREANRHRLCTEVLEFTVTDDLVRAHVRVTDPVTGQYKEDGVAFTRNAFVAKKSLDIVNKHIKKNPGLVVGVEPGTYQPILAPDAQIYGVPAGLFMAKEILKSWNFLGRFAVTTAERRCQDKLLNAEFREREEIELEQQEMADVQEGA